MKKYFEEALIEVQNFSVEDIMNYDDPQPDYGENETPLG